MLRGDDMDIDDRALETFDPARMSACLTLKTKTTKTL